jgi:hypothetical protein
MDEREYLEHFGILGMHWGHHKAYLKSISERPKKEKTKKEKTYIDSKKVINGRNLSQDLLKDVGVLLGSKVAARSLVANGKLEVASILSIMGSAYAITDAALSVHLRRTKRGDEDERK